MKKYWKAAFLTLFILMTFSVLYIQAAVEKINLPEFELATVFDTNRIDGENVTITGDFQMNGKIETFEITNEGTLYARDLGYFERRHGFYLHPAIARLIEEERSFMRGKYEEVNLFFEDDEKLYYADPPSPGMNNFKLDVEILDKTTGNKESFNVTIPEEGRPDHGYMVIAEVQLVNDKLHIFTYNTQNGQGDIYLYEIDLSQEIISNHKPIIIGTDRGSLWLVNESSDISKKPYLVFNVNEMEWNEETLQGKTIHEELLAYHVETGEKTVIKLSDKALSFLLNEEENLLNGDYTVQDDRLYFIYHLTEDILIETYDLASGMLESVKEIKAEEKAFDGIHKIISKDEKLYIFSNLKNDGHYSQDLFIYELHEGELLYQGEIKLKDQAVNLPIYDFEVYNVYEQ